MGRGDKPTSTCRPRQAASLVASLARSAARLFLSSLIALAACSRTEPKSAPDAGTGDAASGPLSASSHPSSYPSSHPLPRPKVADAELGVLTGGPRDELTALIAPASLAAMLEARHCGPPPACDAVRAAVRDPKTVEIALERTDDWGLPPEATLDTVARGLSAAERASLRARPTVIVVRARGAADRAHTTAHIPARAAFAITAALAERTRGMVYDETLRRIETAAEFALHAITAPLGEPAFRDDRIAIQLYEEARERDGEGTVRLVSLGMRRFGAPDVEVRGAPPATGRSLGAVMNAVAARLADGATEAPLAIRIGDTSATVDLTVPPRTEGDPDNAMVSIVPPGGASPAAYDALVRALVGAPDPVVDTGDDALVAAASARAAKSFPGALARWTRAAPPRPTLLVKLPFPLPADAGVEWMWVDVKRADGATLHGTLANAPAYATDLKGGDAVKGARKDVADWLMTYADGGSEGGETIRVLEGRAAEAGRSHE